MWLLLNVSDRFLGSFWKKLLEKGFKKKLAIALEVAFFDLIHFRYRYMRFRLYESENPQSGTKFRKIDLHECSTSQIRTHESARSRVGFRG